MRTPRALTISTSSGDVQRQRSRSTSRSPRSRSSEAGAGNDGVPLTWALEAAESWEEMNKISALQAPAREERSWHTRPMSRNRRVGSGNAGAGKLRSPSPLREMRTSSPYGRRQQITLPSEIPGAAPAFSPPSPLEAEISSPTAALFTPLPGRRSSSVDAALASATVSALFDPTAGDAEDSPPASANVEPVNALDLLQKSAADNWQKMLHQPGHTKIHCSALVFAIGDPTNFDALDEAEQRRRVHVLTRFLNTVSHTSAAAGASKPFPRQNDEAQTASLGADAEAVAESLAESFRKVDILTSLAKMANKGGYDGQLVLSCFANLGRLGLVDALCRHAKVRGAIVGALIAARDDEQLASYALPCAFNLSGHPLLLRSLCSASARVTPALLHYVHDADVADIVTPGSVKTERRMKRKGHAPRVARLPQYFGDPEYEAVMQRCACTLLKNMRASRAAQRSSISVLRDATNKSHTTSAATRLAAWLVGWRPAASSLQKTTNAADELPRTDVAIAV